MASGNFERCLPFTLQYEGGYVNNPRDPGGETCRGITKATYDAYRKANGKPRQSVKLISDIEVRDIYRTGYWSRIGADMLPKGVDLIAFDCAVNNGPARANSWLDQTRELAPLDRINAIHAKRMGFWRGLKIWAVFGRGWTNRENACLALAKRMAS